MAVKKKSITKTVKKVAPATKAPAKAKTTTAPSSRTTAIRAPMTKSQLLLTISESTGLSKKQTTAVLDELSSLIARHIKKGAAGVFTLPGLVKIKTVAKPARKARKGVNPFTGEAMVFKAKPASTAIKVLPLKALKDMV